METVIGFSPEAIFKLDLELVILGVGFSSVCLLVSSKSLSFRIRLRIRAYYYMVCPFVCMHMLIQVLLVYPINGSLDV